MSQCCCEDKVCSKKGKKCCGDDCKCEGGVCKCKCCIEGNCKCKCCKEGKCKCDCCKEGGKCKKYFEGLKKIKKELRIAIGVMCADLDPLYQAILCKVTMKYIKRVKRNSKGECKCEGKCECKCPCKGANECKGVCNCGCKKEDCCPIMCFVKRTVKEFILDGRDLYLNMIKLIFNAFTKAKGIPPPPPMPLPKEFIKNVSKIMFKIYDKKASSEELQEEIAIKFWEKKSNEKMKNIKKKIKKLVSKVISYSCIDCDRAQQKGVIKAAARELFKFCMSKCVPPTEEKKEEGKCGSCGPICPCCPNCSYCKACPYCPCGPCKSFGPCQPFGKKNKCMKKMFKGFMTMAGVKFTVDYINANKEITMACFKIAKDLVEGYIKENSPLPCCCSPDKFRKKLISKIVADELAISAGEKKSDEFYTDFTKRFIRGYGCFCDKKCVKAQRKFAKNCLMFAGLKGKCKLHVASRWAGLMFCQEKCKECCGKGDCGEKCGKEACAEFVNKWSKDYIPIVEEGFKAINELKEEFKEKCKDQCKGPCQKMMCKLMRKMLLKYLKLNSLDKKFDKEDFKTSFKTGKEAMKKVMENYEKRGCPCKCGKK